MRSWTSLCSTLSHPRLPIPAIVGSLLAGVLAGGDTACAATAWIWNPWLGVAAGHESDLILDPELESASVPGGLFLDLAPGASLSRRVGLDGWLRLTGQATVERFLENAERTLFGGNLTADLVIRSQGPWEWRASLGGNYFTDSRQETVERLSGGLESSLAFVQPRWRCDAFGGVQGRRYPSLLVSDSTSDLAAYTDGTASLGARGALRPADSLLLTAEVIRQGTAAKDTYYDATAWTLQGSIQWRLMARTWLTVTGLGQQRRFTSRAPGEDEDSFWRLGAGLLHNLGDRTSLGLRYGLARYTWTSGHSEESYRVALAFTWYFGRDTVRVAPLAAPGIDDSAAIQPRENVPWTFRVQAPAADRVALVGDFNGWNPDRHPLLPAGDDWWQLTLALPAGSYQYAYWVDGTLLTPPEAAITVGDGFGGRNGLLQVLPAGP